MAAANYAVADHEHERLHGDAADEVARGDTQLAFGDRRDRDRQLGQAAGDREEDHAAERLAELEAIVQGVGCSREIEPGNPRRDRSRGEDGDQCRAARAGT